MSLTHRPLAAVPPVRFALRQSFPHSLLFGLAAGGVVSCLAWGLSQLPQPDAAAFQAREAALGQCSDAITSQTLTGHHIDGFRLLPSSVTQVGSKVSAQYRVREHGAGGWNSGPIFTLNCEVMGGTAHLSVAPRVETSE